MKPSKELELLHRHVKALFESEDLTLLKAQVSDMLDNIVEGSVEEVRTDLAIVQVTIGSIQVKLDLLGEILEMLK